MTVRWLTAFIDRPAGTFSATTRFWTAVTGSAMSAPRGEHGEFATLLPPDGDPYLRVQRVARGAGDHHLDVHVSDIGATAQRATELGARVRRELDDVIVLRSPSGCAFCVVGHESESVRPAPIVLGGTARSLVDQLCLDVPFDRFDDECEFWAALTGWEQREGSLPEFTVLARPEGMPLRLVIQRLADPIGDRHASAHLDLACDDVDAVAAAHEQLGARVLRRHAYWTTMTDPSGVRYCLTSRDPDTGTIGG